MLCVEYLYILYYYITINIQTPDSSVSTVCNIAFEPEVSGWNPASDNFISSYPGTPFREDALYYKFLSSYEIAINSVYYKKLDRLKELQGIYDIIKRYYPETLFIDDLDKKMERAAKEISLLENNTTATAK